VKDLKAMDAEVAELFEALQRYVNPLLSRDSYSKFSKQEGIVLALQCINRINQKIGKEARSSRDESGYLRLLQARVNNVTIALKNENVPALRASLASLRSLIVESGSRNQLN
jgi:hypothetical protein